jgi:hypothetical protein
MPRACKGTQDGARAVKNLSSKELGQSWIDPEAVIKAGQNEKNWGAIVLLQLTISGVSSEINTSPLRQITASFVVAAHDVQLRTDVA